jgi:hypothetical protein
VTVTDIVRRSGRRRAAVVRMPRGITETQSYTWVLREAFVAALLPLFDGFTLLRTNQKPIQKQDLPVLGVYILQERMSPDGDLNAGDIRFIHEFQIGFSIVIANNDPDVAEQKLDAAWWSLMHGLWCNDSLTNMLVPSGTGDNTRIEGVVAGHREFVYGAVGLNNETPTAEIRYECLCKYRTRWDPVITNDLDLIVMTIAPENADPTQVQPIEVQYDFTGGTGATGRDRGR